MVAKTYFEDVAERRRIEAEAIALHNSRLDSAANWTKAVAGLLGGNESVMRGAFSGNTNNFLESAATVSTIDTIGTIAGLVILSFAGKASSRVNRRAGLSRDISPRSIRQTAAAQGTVLAENLESQLREFSQQWNRRTPSQRAANLRDFHRAIRESAEEDVSTIREDGGTSEELREAQDRVNEANNMFSRWTREAADLDRELNEAIDTQAPPADVADLVIPDVPDSAISRMVDELDPNVVNEVLNERVRTATENTYNAELSATHPELARFTRTENMQQFNRSTGRYPTNSSELLRFMRSRDASRLLVLYPALVTTAAATTTTAAAPSTTAAPSTARRLPEGDDPAEGIVIKPGGGQEVLPTKAGVVVTDPPPPSVDTPTQPRRDKPQATPEDLPERSLRPQAEESAGDADMKREGVSAETSQNKEAAESFYIKETVVEHNTDELLERAIFWSRKAYDPQAEYEKQVYKIDAEHFAPIVHIDETRGRLYVAFKGTNPLSLMEWISDVTMTGGETLPNAYRVWEDKLTNSARTVNFHSGFLNVLSQVYQPLLQLINNFQNRVTHIVTCGHSAGGALASMFTFLYNADQTIENSYPLSGARHSGAYDGEKIPITKCITFASPRCLINTDEAHAIYSEYCPDVTRVWLIEDLITYLPLHDQLLFEDPVTFIPYGFVHVGVSFCLDGNRIRNNINLYMTDAVQKSRDVLDDLLQMEDRETVTRLMDLTTSGEFLTYLFTGVIQCARYTECKNINEFEQRALALNVQKQARQLNTYAQKCEILKPFSVSDYLKTLPYGKDNDDTQNYTTAYASFIFVAENIKMHFEGNSAHSASTYEERLRFLISRQINTRENITDPIRPENTERGQTLNALKTNQKETVEIAYVLGMYEGEYNEGDMIEF
tara:strand:+ start:2362 stop:5046 length:2685 start_codon:yes stop_codon:yes gene_type:complete